MTIKRLIGPDANQISQNKDFGTMAWQDANNYFNTGMQPSFRNKIINGDMRIDQRNNGVALTISAGSGYSVDRFFGQCDSGSFTMQRVADAPQGFSYSLKIATTSTSSTGQHFFGQYIEGYNFADAAWGASSAKPITISFWVKSNVVGAHPLAVEDAAGSRCYATSYTIQSLNTWEYKTITVPGETTGSNWNKSTGQGVGIWFDYGTNSAGAPNVWATSDAKRASGTVQLQTISDATLQVTGIQVEIGTIATTFENRPYGVELQLCQRYYWQYGGTTAIMGVGMVIGSTGVFFPIKIPVTMRAAPTVTFNSQVNWRGHNTGGGGIQLAGITATGDTTSDLISIQATLSASVTSGYANLIIAGWNSAPGYLYASAEL